MKRKEVISIDGLSLSFEMPKGVMKPLRNLTLKVYEGEILVILGESGAGKSLLVKSIMGMLPFDAKVTKGEIHNLFHLEDMSMVLQDPKKLLDPSMTMGKQIMESLKYAGVKKSERRMKAIELLEEVAMDEPKKRFNQYVHELSGGLAQRAVMAVALAKRPKLLLADEPTTALDEGNEEKITQLLLDLSRKKGMTTILITHNLKVARKVADRIAVMYAGKIIEIGKKDEVLLNPVHPYTEALIMADALVQDEKGNLKSIKGMASCPMNFPVGDAFSIRNPDALVIDFLEEPPMMKVTDTHYAATWLLDPRYNKCKASCNERGVI